MEQTRLCLLAAALLLIGFTQAGCTQSDTAGYRPVAEPTEDPLAPPAKRSESAGETLSADAAEDVIDSTADPADDSGAISERSVASNAAGGAVRNDQSVTGADADPEASPSAPPEVSASESASEDEPTDTAAAIDAATARPAETAGQPAGAFVPETEPSSATAGTAAPAESPGAAEARQPAGANGASREITLLVPEKSFRAEGPEGAIRVSYDDIDLLKVLNMEPVPPDAPKHFPDWLSSLDGRRIRIRGFMYPPFEETGIRMFILARDNEICCFGRNPKIYDVFPVVMREGETTDYIQNRPFDVVGVFHIQPESDGDELFQLYLIDDAVVID